MDRVQKKEVVAELDQIFSESGAVVVAHYAGLTVAEMSTLRAQMREAGAQAKVAKNKLAKIALEGKHCEGISQYLTGQTMLAFSEDPIAAAKVAVEFAKKNEKLVILGGSMGDTILDENGVKSLASMPSLDELRGKIVGLIQAPATKLAAITQAPAAQLARVFNAYATKDEAA